MPSCSHVSVHICALISYQRSSAEERYRLTSGEVIGHAELTIGGQVLMLSDEFPGMNTSPSTLGGTTTTLVIMVSNTDEAFARALTLPAPAGRAAALVDAERLLLDSAPLTPVYFNTKIWLMSPRVRDWQEDGLWSRCYQTIYLDEK